MLNDFGITLYLNNPASVIMAIKQMAVNKALQ